MHSNGGRAASRRDLAKDPCRGIPARVKASSNMVTSRLFGTCIGDSRPTPHGPRLLSRSVLLIASRKITVVARGLGCPHAGTPTRHRVDGEFGGATRRWSRPPVRPARGCAAGLTLASSWRSWSVCATWRVPSGWCAGAHHVAQLRLVRHKRCEGGLDLPAESCATSRSSRNRITRPAVMIWPVRPPRPTAAERPADPRATHRPVAGPARPQRASAQARCRP